MLTEFADWSRVVVLLDHDDLFGRGPARLPPPIFPVAVRPQGAGNLGAVPACGQIGDRLAVDLHFQTQQFDGVFGGVMLKLGGVDGRGGVAVSVIRPPSTRNFR